jgi:hypothetical protein
MKGTLQNDIRRSRVRGQSEGISRPASTPRNRHQSPGVQLKVMSPPESFLFILSLSSFSSLFLTKEKDKEERRKRK